MKETNTIWTGHNAVAATDAPFSVYEDNSVSSLVGRSDRANLDTGWSITLVAKLRHKKCFRHIDWIDFLFMANLGFSKPIPGTHG